MIQFFGDRWDAPQVDPPATQVPTPVGQACLHCAEPIAAGDRGLLRLAVRVEGAAVEPVHMECDLRMTLGDMNHLTGQCLCAGHQAEGGVHVYATARQEALAVLGWWNERRASACQPPL